MFDLVDAQGVSVLGGPVSIENVFLNCYGIPLPGERQLIKLEVGESTLLEFSTCETNAIYRAVRVS